MKNAYIIILSSITSLSYWPAETQAMECYYNGGYDRYYYEQYTITTKHYTTNYCTVGQQYSATNPYTQSSSWYQNVQLSEEERKRRECVAEAQRTKEECKDSYKTLNNLCRGTNAILARFGGIAIKHLLGKISGVGASEKVVQATKEGATAAGLIDSNVVIPCGELSGRATAFCEQGAQKMKNECGG